MIFNTLLSGMLGSKTTLQPSLTRGTSLSRRLKVVHRLNEGEAGSFYMDALQRRRTAMHDLCGEEVRGYEFDA